MKVFKFSLIAVMAAGAMTSISATPLEDAIKDIDVSGFGRYRYENYHASLKDEFSGYELKMSDASHRFTLDVNFKATLDDNFFSVIGLRYDTIDISGAGNILTSAYKGISNTHGGLNGINGTWGGDGDSLSIREYYIGYKGIADTTILAGRQPVNSFFTDDVVGTGIKVLNNSIEGLTLGAFAFDNIEDDEDLGSIFSKGYDYTDYSLIFQNNLYGAAGIYSYEWFNAEAWYAHLQNVTNLWAVDLNANYAINDDFSVRGRVNVGGGHFTKSMFRSYHPVGQKESDIANTTIVGVNLGLTYDWFSLDAGYITYGKKDKTSVLTLENKGKYIKSGEYVLDYTYITGKHNVWFGKVGFKYDAFSLGLDYTYDKIKNTDAKTKTNAFTIRAGYKYNDKLDFVAWWELLNTKYSEETIIGVLEEKVKTNHFRIDARYNF